MTRSRPTAALLFALVVALLSPLPAAPADARSERARTAAADRFSPPPGWAGLCDSMGPAGTRLVRGVNCRWLRMDGVFRRWLVQVPRDRAFRMSRTWPVVMVIHGSGSSGERIRQRTAWPRRLDEVGAIGIFPTAWRYRRFSNGLKVTRWNTWDMADQVDLSERTDGYPEDAPWPTRDTAFLRAILRDLRSQVTVDKRHIHASGTSQGGRFMSRIAVELSPVVASVSCFAWCDAPPADVEVPRRVSVLFGVGALDEQVLELLAERLDPDPRRLPTTWPRAWPVLRSLLKGHLRAWSLPDEPSATRTTAAGLNAVWQTTGGTPRWTSRLRLLVFDGVTHEPPTSETNTLHLDWARMSWEFFRENPLP